MATKKAATGSAAATIATAATKHGTDAFGARYVKPKFAFTAERDLAFALGYPHYVTIVDGHAADASAASREAFLNKRGLEVSSWPRGVAARVVRFWDDVLDEDARRAALAQPLEHLSDPEAEELAKRGVFASRGGALLHILEALVGPSPVWRGVRAALEAEGHEKLAEDEAYRGHTIYDLGFVLYRLPKKEAEGARALLGALYDDLADPKAPPRDAPDPVRQLDVLLHGGAGSERSGHRYGAGILSPVFLGHVVDDPAHVARTLMAVKRPFSGDTPDPRRAFLGDEEALRYMTANWKAYADRPLLVDGLGSIRSPLVVTMMIELSAAAATRKLVMPWFASHAAFARPVLRAAAGKRDDAGKLAKGILAELG